MGRSGLALAELARRRGRMDWALRLCGPITRRWPDCAPAWRLMGELLLACDRPGEALFPFRRAVALREEDPRAHEGLARGLAAVWRFGEAIVAMERALALAPESPRIRIGLARILKEGGQLAEALALAEAVVVAHPDDVEAMSLLSVLMEAWGRVESAMAVWRKLLRLWPDHPALHYNLSRLKRFVADDPQIAHMERLLARPGLPVAEAIPLAFALSKACEDVGREDEAFTLLERANGLMRSTLRYDGALVGAYFDRIRSVFHPAFLAANRDAGDPSRLPVFIVGMPRSGTTLVEQILASHPWVHGGGERYELIRLTRVVRDRSGPGRAYPESVMSLAGERWEALGRTYLAEARRLAPEARHVTDKMPHNFLHVGFIALALPNARIIHCRRDPLDTCLSCYRTLFSAPHDYAYDLAELGHYYRHYDRLMEHWQLSLPGRLLELRYEDLVAGPRSEIRRLLDYCQLPWDEGCMRFHETSRAVGTASQFQVRQPLHGAAVGRWRRHASRLEPLRMALGPLASGLHHGEPR